MTVLLVESSRPEALVTAASDLGGKVMQLNSAIDAQRKALTELKASWEGKASQAALDRAERDLKKQTGFRDQLEQTKKTLQTGGTHLSQARSALLGIVNSLRSQGWRVSDQGVATPPPTLPPALKSTAQAWTAVVQRLLTIFDDIDKRTASNFPNFGPLSTDGNKPLFVGSDKSDKKEDKPEAEVDRRQNQIDAFRQVYGRDPARPNDWKMAAILDPNSYHEKNAGVPANVVVGRITPVPGQGVVRTNLFIPQQEVWYPAVPGGVSGHNFGDNRGFDPNAGPEDTRVAVYVDYQNGVIVTRQNPSVDTTTGEARTGTPTVAATQRPDGTLYLRYEAVDPFSPGGETVGKLSPWSVNGNIVIQPTAGGPAVGGNVTSFPAIEMYRDAPNGVTATLSQVMPQNIGQEGPLVGLPLHQDIGNAALVDTFNEVKIVPRGTIVVGPELTALGSPDSPPTIPIRELGANV
jgi:uncharacterized protein YukE